jgi:hypothetical protein
MWQNCTPSVSHIVRFSCAICPVVMPLLFVLWYIYIYISIVLLSHGDRQSFVEVFCEQFQLTAELRFMLRVPGKMTVIAREV